MFKQKRALGVPNELRGFAGQFAVGNSYPGNRIDDHGLHSINFEDGLRPDRFIHTRGIVGVPDRTLGIESPGIPRIERPVVAQPLDQIRVCQEGLSHPDKIGLARIDGSLPIVLEVAAGEKPFRRGVPGVDFDEVVARDAVAVGEDQIVGPCRDDRAILRCMRL